MSGKGECAVQTPREIREAAIRSTLVELTGASDSDRGLIDIYRGYGDAEKRDRAMRLYLVEDKTIDEIAEIVGVPGRTVTAWAYVGKWSQPLAMEVAMRQEEESIRLARLRILRRQKAIRKQLDSAQMVREKVEDDLDDMSAKTAAEALKAAADIENRALGLSESGRTELMDREEKKESERNGSKTPLVFVIRNGSGSGIPTLRKEGEVIDV